MTDDQDTPVMSACYLCHGLQPLNYGMLCKRDLIVPVCIDCLAKYTPTKGVGA